MIYIRDADLGAAGGEAYDEGSSAEGAAGNASAVGAAEADEEDEEDRKRLLMEKLVQLQQLQGQLESVRGMMGVAEDGHEAEVDDAVVAADDAADARFFSVSELADLPTSEGLIEALTEWNLVTT